MRVFLYEFFTGGGLSDRPLGKISRSLLLEGRAMVEAVAADLAASESVRVDRLVDGRLVDGRLAREAGDEIQHIVDSPEAEKNKFHKLAAAADVTILIAPEFDRILQQRAAWIEACGGRLLGPSSAAIALTSDKHRLAEHLAEAGIPVTSGIALDAGSRLPRGFSYPAVLKPRFGAGSQDLVLVADCQDAERRIARSESRLEQYQEGEAASVAVLCGPAGLKTLPPCRQLLSRDGRFTYLGGALPLDSGLAERARCLASAAVDACSGMLGYLGVDLVLGNNAKGDRVVEINPRLTTSYLVLRKACRQNLAEIMLRWALGEVCTADFSDAVADFHCSTPNSLEPTG